MQAAAEHCARLAVALEDLAAQESAALTAGDFETIVALQDRAGPLVDFLVGHAGEVARRPDLSARLGAIHTRRARTLEMLSQEAQRAREELAETGAACGRVARIAPVYGRPAAVVSQLQGVG
ncbi:MAG: hypothetical protein JNK23_02225 [Opitutaceae bacterium]|nr:hypothetical protein [Opitutaceae bacterium]